jgi:hypothetical protein
MAAPHHLMLLAVAALSLAGVAASPAKALTPLEAVRAFPAPPLPAAVAARHARAKRETLGLLAPPGTKRRGGGGGDDGADCDGAGYRNRVMGLLHEANLLGLFKDLRGQGKLEASGMDVVGAHDLWVVFDNTPLVGLVDLHFAYEGEGNVLIPPLAGGRDAVTTTTTTVAATPRPANASRSSRRAARRRPPPPRLRGQEDSQFEGISQIASRPGEFIIVEEMREVGPAQGAARGGNTTAAAPIFHPFAQRVALSRRNPDGYKVLERCTMHLVLKRENKGIEGIEYVEDTRGKGYLLAACEGNWCEGGRRGRDRGHGKIAVLEFVPAARGGGEPCSWRVAKTLDIPPAAAFTDYSDLAFADTGLRGEPAGSGKGAVAVLSQEDAALWVGQFDYDRMEFDADVPGAAFVLPRDGACRTVWCNAEGLVWLDARRLAVATDRAKASQSFVCTSKDEALGTFALPDGADRMIFGDGEGGGEAGVAGGEEAAAEERATLVVV